jgi:hypothetical protein
MPLIPGPRRSGRRFGMALIVAASTAVTSAGPARADDWFGWTDCSDRPTTPGCEVGARAPGAPERTTRRAAARSSTGATSPGTASQQCHDLHGRPTPCYDPELGHLGSDGCYYRPAPAPPADLQAIIGGAGQGPGGWYEYVCPGQPGTGGGIRWIADTTPGPVAVDPAVLARQAVSRLDLPQPRIGMSPSGAQLVAVPTWLWLDPGSWRPRSATARVPGLAVTATAAPSRVVWRTGDGATVTCAGPGTAWTPGTDPARPSPTCGHVYRRGSVGMPGGMFTVTATVTWDVEWSGGGRGGTVPGLSTVSTAAVPVAEVQAVVAG